MPSEPDKSHEKVGGATPGPGSSTAPDRTEVYTAIRAHELMLNEAAAAQERSVIAPLLTLNGGAAAAFLTLLGSDKRDSSLIIDVWWARLAVAAWVGGLLLAAGSAWAGASRQAKVNEGYRLMREEVEARLFPDLADVVAPKPMTSLEREADREKARDAAKLWSRVYRLSWTASAPLFAIGAFLALAAVVIPHPYK